MFHFPTMHPEAIYLLPFPKNYYAEDYVGYQQTFSALSVPKTGTLAAASLPTSHISWDPIDQSLLTSLSQLFAISKLQTQAFELSQLPTRKSDGLPAYFIHCLCSPRLDSTPWVSSKSVEQIISCCLSSPCPCLLWITGPSPPDFPPSLVPMSQPPTAACAVFEYTSQAGQQSRQHTEVTFWNSREETETRIKPHTQQSQTQNLGPIPVISPNPDA